MKTIEVEADVLVVGGGLAGTSAALRARDFADKVVLVDKARVARSGATTSAAGVMLCPTKEDDLSLWMKEIVDGKPGPPLPGGLSQRDNKNWLKWVDLEKRDGRMILSTEPVPLHKYQKYGITAPSR